MKNWTTSFIVALFLIIPGCNPVVEKLSMDNQALELQCRAACDHIGPKGLDCEEGRPVPMKGSCSLDAGRKCQPPASCSDGKCTVDCVTFCVDTQKSGAGISPECVAKVTNCAAIDACRFSR